MAMHGKHNTDPLNLRLLRPEESWELLEKRAFGNESCPDELFDVGKEIAQNCKEIPLVVDLIAGVIAGTEKKKTLWLEVRNNLHSFIFKNEVEVKKVIEISYDHLPDHLKLCFLYFASRPKDSAIPIYELKAVWGAEGFVEKTEMKSMEEVVKFYLDDLISNSLVVFFNEIGDDPTCQLHDLVHEFCLIKAREEKLFDQISSSALSSSSSDLMPRTVTIDYHSELFGPNNFVLFSSKEKRHSGKHLYSLRIYGDKLDSRLFDACHLRHLRLLRVLDLNLSFIKNLEILSVYNKGSTLVLLLRIWDLVKLRVLSMSACSFFDMDADESILIAEDTKLENLRSLENLLLSYSKDIEDIFERFPNLQGEEWNMGAREVTLAKWEVGEESFPVLEKLKLCECCKLEEIPPSFGDICSLRFIKLVESPQLEDSALKIKHYAEDMWGGDELQVVGRKNIPERGKENEGERDEEEENESFPSALSSSSMLRSPPSGHGTAMGLLTL
ncbi:hypothetical protein RDI58_026806 [Solanum bulbocastanum]|uniref:Disease resistance protein winged helix domain-containing protein n=1 Tax=Solanum bulbocastanum TaxID=147425 RepID=A0AAN8SUB7_SOLBU